MLYNIHTLLFIAWKQSMRSFQITERTGKKCLSSRMNQAVCPRLRSDSANSSVNSLARFMLRGLMTHHQEHLSGVPQTHLRYSGHVHTRYATYTYTGVALMGGCLIVWQSTGTTRGLLHSTTGPSSQVKCGMVLTSATALLLRGGADSWWAWRMPS